MVFSSLFFIFRFLPVVITLYVIVPKKFKNFILFVSSLFFYAWGQPHYVILMIVIIAIIHSIALLIQKTQHQKTWLVTGILFSISLLLYYKYANFIISNVNILISQCVNYTIPEIKNLRYPVGVSFFTFQCVSYLIDIYRKRISAEKNIINVGLLISFFPKVMQGPIVRYETIASQFKDRNVTLNDIYYGIYRFIIGLSKKVMIADVMGTLTDQIFALPYSELTIIISWIGAIAYTIQIYFDFSGYTDMALGLAKLFGFTLPENFNYPYISHSIREFWRRWHITLSLWFRDYLYIPLGGNKKGNVRTYINLYIVFFATGLWHGESWNFIVWGLFHGTFIVLERLGLEKILQKSHVLWRHMYATLVFITGWVLFRASNLTHALYFFAAMFNPFKITGKTVSCFMDAEYVIIMILGIIFSYPVAQKLHTYFDNHNYIYIADITRGILAIILFIMSVMFIVNSSYSPFLYFRF